MPPVDANTALRFSEELKVYAIAIFDNEIPAPRPPAQARYNSSIL